MSRQVKVYSPRELGRDDWHHLQTIQRDALSAALDRSQREVDGLVEWLNPKDYIASHIDPNVEAGGRFRPGQSYSYPRVAVATEGREPIGFAYSAHNVSGGSGRGRLVKRLTLLRNYLWLREVAVRPDRQRQGVARDLGRALLADGISFQPVTAYIWPEETGFLKTTLMKLGFDPTEEQPVPVFGDDSEPTAQLRMQAPSARSVLKKLA